MTNTYFITGTDTEIGKTTVTTLLLNHYNQQGLTTLGLKPLASGSDDALQLQQASSLKLPYDNINPINYQLPVSPDIAARIENRPITVNQLLKSTQPSLQLKTDLTLIEGIGGWQVPINETETMADYVKALNIPVILVVGIKLGC